MATTNDAPAAPEAWEDEQYKIESVILRRLHENRIDGYTIEMAQEITRIFAARIEQLTREKGEWIDEVTAILADDKDVVRVCEGGGPEDLRASLAVTVIKTRRERDTANARAEAAEANYKGLKDWWDMNPSLMQHRIVAAEARAEAAMTALRVTRGLVAACALDGFTSEENVTALFVNNGAITAVLGDRAALATDQGGTVGQPPAQEGGE